MEIWLRPNEGGVTSSAEGVDRMFSKQASEQSLRSENGVLYAGDDIIGAHVFISDGTTQHAGIAHLGTVDWIMVECETWSMIPLENLIAHRSGSHTKIAAVIRTPLEAQGAGFALEQGVDALVVSQDASLLDAAFSVKAQRLEQIAPLEAIQSTKTDQLNLTPFEIASVEEAGLGDRYCLDFLTRFREHEGLLVGSSAQALFLVHSETIPSTFVPTRPFRVNAGAPHAYVMMADGTTKYMTELEAGNELLAVDVTGATRPVVLGRIKIEQRPMLKIVGKAKKKGEQNDNTSHVFMQQAETVRLLSDEPNAVSVTDLSSTKIVLGWVGHAARHVGLPVQGGIEER